MPELPAESDGTTVVGAVAVVTVAISVDNPEGVAITRVWRTQP